MEAAGKWVAFLVLEQEDEGCPPKKWHAERQGLCSLGRRTRLERFAGRCCPCSSAASHIFENQCLPGLPASGFFARADLATAVYLIKAKWEKAGPGRKVGVEG